MLSEHLVDIGEDETAPVLSVGDLGGFYKYKAARAKFEVPNGARDSIPCQSQNTTRAASGTCFTMIPSPYGIRMCAVSAERPDAPATAAPSRTSSRR